MWWHLNPTAMRHYKTFILACAALGTLVACNSKDSGKPVLWEYKQVAAEGKTLNDFRPSVAGVSIDELNALGAEGWELVACYDNLETVYPNFGDDKYVTGIQPNVRTSTIFYVFKRPKQAENTPDKK